MGVCLSCMVCMLIGYTVDEDALCVSSRYLPYGMLMPSLL